MVFYGCAALEILRNELKRAISKKSAQFVNFMHIHKSVFIFDTTNARYLHKAIATICLHIIIICIRIDLQNSCV